MYSVVGGGGGYVWRGGKSQSFTFDISQFLESSRARAAGRFEWKEEEKDKGQRRTERYCDAEYGNFKRQPRYVADRLISLILYAIYKFDLGEKQCRSCLCSKHPKRRTGGHLLSRTVYTLLIFRYTTNNQ